MHGHNARSCRNKHVASGIDENPKPGVVVTGVEVQEIEIARGVCVIPTCERIAQSTYICHVHSQILRDCQPQVQYKKQKRKRDKYIDDDEEEDKHTSDYVWIQPQDDNNVTILCEDIEKVQIS